MGKDAKGVEFKKFATPRIVGGVAIVIIVLWALSIIFGPSEDPSSKRVAEQPHDSVEATAPVGDAGSHQATQSAHPPASGDAAAGHATGTSDHGAAAAPGTTGHSATAAHGTTDAHGTTAARDSSGAHAQKTAVQGTAQTAAGAASTPKQQPAAASTHDTQASAHDTAGQPTGHPLPTMTTAVPLHKPMPKGVAFVEAAIKPLDFELEERWWGWRPNDIIDLTDNVNNFQMGVLEVTRRTTVALAERISRTGTTDAFDENLEQAMNWFMIKASSFWFPSAESKYREGLEELQAYLEKLKEGKATFYTRTDNLIPLLASFEDLLGSCDENLVKQVNEDGSPISSFAVDNYFFYTQGVASSMATVLEAVHHDFLLTLEQRNGTELLHHAILSCQRATEIDPWIILDRNLSSVFANHRANMAAPISHARFYLGQLIKTLST